MLKVEWSELAVADLSRLRDFIAEHDPAAAIRAIRAIRQGIRTIAAFPQAGRTDRALLPEYRIWVVPFGGSGYVVIYRVAGSVVTVMAVRHGREAGLDLDP
jgi:plasmid stabilization system protein ParE